MSDESRTGGSRRGTRTTTGDRPRVPPQRLAPSTEQAANAPSNITPIRGLDDASTIKQVGQRYSFLLQIYRVEQLEQFDEPKDLVPRTHGTGPVAELAHVIEAKEGLSSRGAKTAAHYAYLDAVTSRQSLDDIDAKPWFENLHAMQKSLDVAAPTAERGPDL